MIILLILIIGDNEINTDRICNSRHSKFTVNLFQAVIPPDPEECVILLDAYGYGAQRTPFP